jgi:hypothetical protein
LIRSGRLVWALLYHGAGASKLQPADHGAVVSNEVEGK